MYEVVLAAVQTQTANHFLGPWTGYIIGLVLAIGLLWLNKKI